MKESCTRFNHQTPLHTSVVLLSVLLLLPLMPPPPTPAILLLLLYPLLLLGDYYDNPYNNYDNQNYHQDRHDLQHDQLHENVEPGKYLMFIILFINCTENEFLSRQKIIHSDSFLLQMQSTSVLIITTLLNKHIVFIHYSKNQILTPIQSGGRQKN